MQTRIGRGVLWFAGALSVGLSCSSPERDYRQRGGAGEAGEAGATGLYPGAAGASSAGESSDGASNGGEAGDHSGGDGGTEAGASGAAGEAGASGAAGEAGVLGTAGGSATIGVCQPGTQRSCADDGAKGACALGKETCGVGATWGACDHKPAAVDTCVADNDDNCNGHANDDCKCINGVTTRACGDCNDGTQTCTDGSSGVYSACQGAAQSTIYHLDKDGDGQGLPAPTLLCAPKAGYVLNGTDCCDDDKDVFLGQTLFFPKSSTACGNTWNYDCSTNGSIELQVPKYLTSCDNGPSCGNGSHAYYDASSCGTTLTNWVCNTIGGGPNMCYLYPAGELGVQGCH